MVATLGEGVLFRALSFFSLLTIEAQAAPPEICQGEEPRLEGGGGRDWEVLDARLEGGGSGIGKWWRLEGNSI